MIKGKNQLGAEQAAQFTLAPGLDKRNEEKK